MLTQRYDVVVSCCMTMEVDETKFRGTIIVVRCQGNLENMSFTGCPYY